MESKTYKDPSINKVIDQKDLNKMVARSLLLQASFNYERMQGGGWTYGLIPGLKKIHTNKEDLADALVDHMEFFNTHPFLVTFIQGVIIAMEENKEPRESIRGVKVALMGPLGGIGDALIWLTLLPITAGIGASIAAEGNIMGPVIFLISFNIVHFFLRFFLMNYGYKMGTRAVTNLQANTQKISRAASIVGLTVIGGLIASYINIPLSLVIKAGILNIDIKVAVFDAIMPALLPLLYTFFCYTALKKGWSPLILILITLLLGVVGVYLHIFPSSEDGRLAAAAAAEAAEGLVAQLPGLISRLFA